MLGFEPGEYHTVYGQMLRVTDAIAQAAQDRVRIVPYGRSVEGRPLRVLALSAPANIARLEEIRAGVARLADPRATSPEEAREIAVRNPAIVWLNYANDGNESAAFESAILTTYELAASEHPEVLQALKGVVVIVNPAHNPESHERFVSWYNAMGMGDSAHIALEHNPFWSLSTNNNHYQIDLNRDFLAQSQRETRAIVVAIRRWNPQVVVDHHGETEQYFFPPTALPMVPTLPWEQQRKWEAVFGRANAAAFDRHGWLYYTRHIFDYYYPGYADVWPSLNGATGMTYETFAGGDLGYRWRKEDGSVATLRDGIARHFTASFATVQAAAAHREERWRDYYEFRRSGMAAARTKPYARFVLTPGDDPERAARLVE
ncbi:MAG: M14 family zinc carboxypeptidase, partial [Gemmatimonadota bacterium]